MKENEVVRDMYSCLNLMINELNSIGINKLGDADIVRKIISLLPQQRYGSIITILHSLDDWSQMTMMIVIGKIATFEMSRKMGQEEPTSSNPYAFACDEHKKMKGKKKAPSSSEEEVDDDDDDDDDEDDRPSTSSSKDEETVYHVRKVMGMICKINLMDVP
jgi:DNA replication protein DnaC